MLTFVCLGGSGDGNSVALSSSFEAGTGEVISYLVTGGPIFRFLADREPFQFLVLLRTFSISGFIENHLVSILDPSLDLPQNETASESARLLI